MVLVKRYAVRVKRLQFWLNAIKIQMPMMVKGKISRDISRLVEGSWCLLVTVGERKTDKNGNLPNQSRISQDFGQSHTVERESLTVATVATSPLPNNHFG